MFTKETIINIKESVALKYDNKKRQVNNEDSTIYEVSSHEIFLIFFPVAYEQ